MEISNKDKKLLVYLLAVVIIAAAYMFGAKPLLDKQLELNEEIESLDKQVSHYAQIYNMKDNYEAKALQYEDQYQDMKRKFFSGINQEDTIVLLKGIERETNVWISKVAFQESQVLVGASQEGSGDSEGDASQDAVASAEFSGVKQDLSIDYSANYEDFKKFLDFVKNNEQRLYISTLNAVYAVDTGRVSGSIILSQYALDGSGVDREIPDLSGIDIGVDNIFTSGGGADVNFGTLNNPADEVIQPEDGLPENIDDTDNSGDAEGEEAGENPEVPEPSEEAPKPPKTGGGVA